MGWLLGASYYGKAYSSDAGVQLHDEGPLKVSAALAARSPSLMEGLVRKLSLPDLTVALTVDPEVAFKRVHQRGQDYLSFETIAKWVKAQEKGIKIVAKWGPTFVADTSHDEDYAEELAELIARHYRGMTGQDDENSVVTASS